MAWIMMQHFFFHSFYNSADFAAANRRGKYSQEMGGGGEWQEEVRPIFISTPSASSACACACVSRDRSIGSPHLVPLFSMIQLRYKRMLLAGPSHAYVHGRRSREQEQRVGSGSTNQNNWITQSSYSHHRRADRRKTNDDASPRAPQQQQQSSQQRSVRRSGPRPARPPFLKNKREKMIIDGWQSFFYMCRRG